MLEFDPKAKVVDLGCGNGLFTLQIRNKIGCVGLYGVDIDENSLAEADKREISVLKEDLNSTLSFPSDFFDVVVSSQVIEHLFYPTIFVQEILRILKKGGYAVVSSENLASWDNILALLLGFTPFSQGDFDGLKIGNPLSLSEKKRVDDTVDM